jgi:hypothetical protein
MIHDVQLYNSVTLNNAIKGCVHRLMQRLGLCSHFEKKASRALLSGISAFF